MSMKGNPLKNSPRMHRKWIETQNEGHTWGMQKTVQLWTSVKFKVKIIQKKRHVCTRIEGKISIVEDSIRPQSWWIQKVSSHLRKTSKPIWSSERVNTFQKKKKKCRLWRLASDARVSYETELPLKIEGRMLRGFLADKAIGSINRMQP